MAYLVRMVEVDLELEHAHNQQLCLYYGVPHGPVLLTDVQRLSLRV